MGKKPKTQSVRRQKKKSRRSRQAGALLFGKAFDHPFLVF
jgi:hypothetical protein